MTEKDLLKMKREQLVALVLQEQKRADAAEAQLKDAQMQLKSRAIQLEEAGSIAEASLRINGVFSAAESAAAQYLESIKEMQSRQWNVCAQLEEESREQARKLLADTEEKCRQREEKAEERLNSVSRRLVQLKGQYQQMMAVLQSGMDIPMELPEELDESDNADAE